MGQFNPAAMEDMTGIFDFPDKNRGVLGALHPTVLASPTFYGITYQTPLPEANVIII